ncbi:myrosinase 1-like [Adelges cooleyi]|uniref:myrosinase 1-like n=1 Tax=Adelges cooleyi TaxID=133065 RepID=UPI0021800D0E|nr:myrosinase 1-like [Adelges cooleyi]XP_050419969.1 myrosinase 1-like [Adelges cooleyi]
MANSAETIKFPDNFLLGTGSSAYQVEGAWNKDGKTPNIWDEFFHSGKHDKHDYYIPKHTISNVEKTIENGVHTIVQKIHDKNQEVKHKLVRVENIFKGFFHYDKKHSEAMCNAPKCETKYCNEDGGEIACDSYNKTDTDVQLLKELGVQVYRFSLSWSRILPKGDDAEPNQAGINYYKNLIQKLLDNNIQPLVTIYHWDLPQALQDIGGWANTNIIRYFTNYCKFVFETFGDKVKLWSTINEPRLIAEGYATSQAAPALGEKFSGIADYMVVHNLILAHAYAYRMYCDQFKEKQNGIISWCVDTIWFFPVNADDEEHKKAADLAFQSFVGIFIQPLVTGEYPQNVVDSVIETNKMENKNIWRILQFTEHEKKIVKGAYDYIAFNYYFSLHAAPMTPEKYKETTSLKSKDLGAELFGFLEPKVPEDTNQGFRNIVDYLDKTMNHPKIFICENGFSETESMDQSLEKKLYHHGILCEVDKAIKRNIDIIGYCVWSFLDSLEWAQGYSSKYGIYGVDFKDPSRPRYKKEKIFTFFERLFKTKTLPPPEIE